MDGIHENDIGHNTRVFEITSVKLNVTTQICVGKVHEDNGKNVYSVYEVNGDHVTRRIGYYEQEEDDFDDDGDFNVAKREEPKWTVEGNTFSEIPESKKAASVKVSKKSLFTVKTNKAQGDCFFEAVLEGEGKKHNAEAVQKLRKEIVDFIDTSPETIASIVDLYNASKPRKIKDVYPELVQKLTDAGEDEAKLEELKQEVAKKVVDELIPENLFSYEILLTVKEDENALLPQDDAVEEETHFMRDYFNDDISLTEEADIIEKYTENLTTPAVFADGLVVTIYQRMRSIMLLVLIGDGKIENSVASIQDVVQNVKKFILLKYSGNNHYELVCYNKQCSFDWKDIPDSIKNKFAAAPWYEEINGKEPELDESDESDIDAEPVPPVPKPAPAPKPAPPAPKPAPPVPKPVPNPLEDGEVDETEPDEPAPEPSEPSEPSVPPVPPVPEPSKPKTKKAVHITKKYNRAQLNAMTVPMLKDIIAQNKDVFENYKQTGTKEHFIDCILDPELEKCYTKVGWVLRTQTGGKFTRKA
jgi:hypothetical protein